MADNDQFRIFIGGTATNAGWVELATADDGTEPIYVRQYTGVFTTITRTAALLDGSGNTYFPGEVTAFSSDRRLKTDVRLITNAVDKVKSLNGIIYKWNELANTLAGYNTTEDLVGLFAQEVDAVLPYAVKPAPFDAENGVSKSGENYLTIQYEKLVPLLVEAIKEQQAKIDRLMKHVGLED